MMQELLLLLLFICDSVILPNVLWQGNTLEGQPIKGSKASISLLQGSIMCPYDRGKGKRRADHGSIDPLSNIRTGAPVPPSGRQESVQEALSLVGLGQNVVMPPQATIKRQTKILGTEAIRDGVTRDGESPGQCGVCVWVKKTT